MATPMPLVSVVIPTYNYGRYVGRAIGSVLAQSYHHVELLVVDDGSTDESERVLSGYGGRLRCIRQARQGVSAARNRGVRESQGELVAFLDADDEWAPQKLERQVGELVREPDLGLIHCGEVVVDESGRRLRERVEGGEGWVADEMLAYRRVVIVAPGSTVLVPRGVFEAVGGFDVRLSTFADWDFCYRAARRYRVGFVPAALVTVRSHPVSMQRNVQAMEHDMLLAYENAFRDASSRPRVARRRCYGRLHMVLAGSFLTAGRPQDGLPHLLKGLWLAPEHWTHVVGYPWRRWQRRLAVLREVDSA